MSAAFTFDNFVTGKANQLARAAAVQVAENPGASYNPLFVYGGWAWARRTCCTRSATMLAAHQPRRSCATCTPNQYITDVVRAYQQKSFDEFKRYYHSLDLLLIDDIQFFSGKDRTQEEFFYAFNALVEGHKQIVITCDTYPRDVSGIDDRLKTRFSWGLTVAVEPPEQEMRVAIVLKKAEAVGIKLDEDVAFFIAKHVRSNVRELEGALKNVLAFAASTASELSVEAAREALKDILSAPNRQIAIENIQRTVAEYLQDQGRRHAREEAQPQRRAAAPDGDGARQGADRR